MSDLNLPEDPARWPTDPYQLLGVPRGVSALDLKRAYTRLIRQYKPEQAPQQFGLIRKAYEIILRIAEIMEQYPAATPPVLRPGEESGDRSESVEPRAEPLPPPRPVDDSAETAWESAVAGDLSGAYAALVSLRRADPAARICRCDCTGCSFFDRTSTPAGRPSRGW